MFKANNKNIRATLLRRSGVKILDEQKDLISYLETRIVKKKFASLKNFKNFKKKQNKNIFTIDK